MGADLVKMVAQGGGGGGVLGETGREEEGAEGEEDGAGEEGDMVGGVETI